MSIGRSIVLVGFMGTGKSTVGRIMASSLGLPLIDTDKEIVRASGMSIPDIFNQFGEGEFRKRETQLLRDLVWRQFRSPNDLAVIATGGGAPLRQENVRLLHDLGKVVWLTASPECILNRIGSEIASRPILASAHQEPRSAIAALLANREASYSSAADIVFDTSPFANCGDAADTLKAHLCQND